MQDDRETTHRVEIIPPDRIGARPGQSHGGRAEPLSPVLRTVIMVAAVSAAFGLLALLVMFAATVALIAVPAALVAGGAAWLGLRVRAWRGRG